MTLPSDAPGTCGHIVARWLDLVRAPTDTVARVRKLAGTPDPDPCTRAADAVKTLIADLSVVTLGTERKELTTTALTALLTVLFDEMSRPREPASPPTIPTTARPFKTDAADTPPKSPVSLLSMPNAFDSASSQTQPRQWVSPFDRSRRANAAVAKGLGDMVPRPPPGQFRGRPTAFPRATGHPSTIVINASSTRHNHSQIAAVKNTNNSGSTSLSLLELVASSDRTPASPFRIPESADTSDQSASHDGVSGLIQGLGAFDAAAAVMRAIRTGSVSQSLRTSINDGTFLHPDTTGNGKTPSLGTSSMMGDGMGVHQHVLVETGRGEMRVNSIDLTTELNQYVLLDCIGRGAQGEVHLAMDTDANEFRAIKAVPRPTRGGGGLGAARQRRWDDLKREVAIMKRCRHRNLVALYEVIDDPTQDTMYLVMQYVERGPLASLREDGSVSRTVEAVKLAEYGLQLSGALAYLHRQGVVHRDIKPENILLGQNDQVYLADFGVSEVFDGPKENRKTLVTGTRGTTMFLAPELVADPKADRQGSPCIPTLADFSTSDAGSARVTSLGASMDAAGVSGEAVDVWALGLTFYALLYGKLPWHSDDARALFKEIQEADIELAPVNSGREAQSGAQLSSPDDLLDSPSSAFTHAVRVRDLDAVSSGDDSSDEEMLRSVAAPMVKAAASHELAAELFMSMLRSDGRLANLSSTAPPDCSTSESFSTSTARCVSGCEGPKDLPDGSMTLPMTEQVADDPLHPTTATSGHTRSAHPTTATATNSNSSARSAQHHATTIDARWRRLLAGMLRPDPKRRFKLHTIRRALLRISAQGQNELPSPGSASAITTLNPPRRASVALNTGGMTQTAALPRAVAT